MFKRLGESVATIMARDPAARSRLEVVLCYAGFHAVVFHRIAHALWQGRLKLLARMVSQLGRFLTGIEIHPGAKIGRRLFIDHGMGVVIGGTAEVGDDVTLYHGVTLGGTSLERDVKRHPTLEDGVIVGSGASVLGPITIGAGARIGANAVVVGTVPPGATMVGVPAKQVSRGKEKAKEEFLAYGTPDKIPDPVQRALDGLLDQVSSLSARLEEVERQRRDDAKLAAEPVPAEGRELGRRTGRG